MDITRKKLLYQSWHRGCKETDGVLGNFAEQFLPDCSEEELINFSNLLEEDDWDIWQWLTVPGSMPPRFAPLLQRIQASQPPQIGKRNG